jgi:lipoate-protein ligase A
VGAFKVRDVASAVGRGLAEQFGIQLEPGALKPAEAEAAGRLAASRYADAAWMAAPALAEAGNTTRTR